jgi:hypothetical protein
MIKDTRAWQIGRRGEILQMAVLASLGYRLVDVSGSSNNKAPLLLGHRSCCITADAIGFRTGPLNLEFKTKEHHTEWRGGSRWDEVPTAPRLEEGWDYRKHESYSVLEKVTGLPVVVTVLSIKEGELLANSLRRLGKPRRSPNQAFDFVSWDIKSFRRVCTFDLDRLHSYFFLADGTLRHAPTDVPSANELRRVVDFLRPALGEFEPFVLDLIDQMEVDWRGDA